MEDVSTKNICTVHCTCNTNDLFISTSTCLLKTFHIYHAFSFENNSTSFFYFFYSGWQSRTEVEMASGKTSDNCHCTGMVLVKLA